VRVRGNFHQVGSFLGRLSNLERIVNVTELSLEQPADRKTKKKTSTTKKKDAGGEPAKENKIARSTHTVEAKFTLTAYTLLGGVTNETVNDQHARND
jgi:Tfp pilus assembly protein PilO